MCLIVKGGKKKAKTDIVCYKIMAHYPRGICSRYHSFMMWEVGKEYQAFRACSGFIKKYKEIHEGYFHSYCEIPITDINKDNEYVYECIIPKGTWYFQGMHTDGYDGYASKSLKVIRCLQK